MLNTIEKAATVEDQRGYNYKTTVREIIERHAPKEIGFYRELIDVETTKCYGTQELVQSEIENDLDRFVGFYGGRIVTYPIPFEMQRGHRIVIVKASKENPKVCREHIYPHI